MGQAGGGVAKRGEKCALSKGEAASLVMREGRLDVARSLDFFQDKGDQDF